MDNSKCCWLWICVGDVPQRVRRGEFPGAGGARGALFLVHGVPGRDDDLAVPPRTALPPALPAAHAAHGHRRAARQVALYAHCAEAPLTALCSLLLSHNHSSSPNLLNSLVHMSMRVVFHVSMVQRMIGSKMGTGGSSGYQYLRATVR